MRIHEVSACAFIMTWTICANNVSFAANKTHETPIKQKLISITDNLFGPTVLTMKDGTRIIKNKNGSSVQIYPDGSLFIINSDGSTIQKNSE